MTNYEILEGSETFSMIAVYADDGAEQIFSCSDVGLPYGEYTKKEWMKALEAKGYSITGMVAIEGE